MRRGYTTTTNSENDGGVEMQHLIDPGYIDMDYVDMEEGKNVSLQVKVKMFASDFSKKLKQVTNTLQQRMLELDEACNINLLMRWWCPCLDVLARIILVLTFFDDSLRITLHFNEHTKQIREEGVLRWLLVPMSPEWVSATSTLLLGIGVLAQFFGSICILARVKVDCATIALISWIIVQPVLYSQLFNIELVAESLSLIGGLLMLRAHLVYCNAGFDAAESTKLVARLLLPIMYLYYAGKCLVSAVALEETDGFMSFNLSLSAFALNSAVLVASIISSMLAAVGLQSRLMSLILAAWNLVYVFRNHPFFCYIYLKGGHWEIKPIMSMPSVALPSDINVSDLDLWQIYDLHRYYFFLGLSTSGALLILSQFDPGEISVQTK